MKSSGGVYFRAATQNVLVAQGYLFMYFLKKKEKLTSLLIAYQ